MYTYEYICEQCGQIWIEHNDYSPIECPSCKAENIIQIDMRRSYD